MKTMLDLPKSFAKGIARSWVSLLGALIVTAVTPFLMGALIYDTFWHITNTYFSASVYMILGPVFITGLVMVFLGLFFFKGKEEVRLFSQEYLQDFFSDPHRFNRLRQLIFVAVFLTGVNLFIFGLLGYKGYHYMESVGFCGQFCHSVMQPEFTAYKQSPHSNVPCVDCHIGDGATWFVKSKISGTRQLYAVALDTYPRPIETPVHGLRPARETCEECHRPNIFHGEKLVVREKFLADEKSTNVKTVLTMKIGSAGDRAVSPHGIHWHVAPQNRIVYAAEDYNRMVIPEVTLFQEDGTKIVFKTEDAEEKLKAAGGKAIEREMDCIDCHNRPSHIYLTPDDALDRKLVAGGIPQDLPFIKREALRIITRSYPSQQEAKTQIASELTAWYQKNYPDLVKAQEEKLKKAIQGVQEAYSENVFPEMNLEWNTYVNHLGHGESFDIGCFRCHDDQHVSESGEVISGECNTCHNILAEDEVSPEILEVLK